MEVAHSVATVRSLVKLVRERRFVIPDIQRPFVWDMKRIRMLVQSMIENVPIGGIVIWSADEKQSASIRETSSVLPGYDLSNKKKLFVIDGQQRLSVLYQLFEGAEYEMGRSRRIHFGTIALNVAKRSVVTMKSPTQDHVYVADLLGPHYNSYIRAFKKKKDQQWLRSSRQQILGFRIPMTTVSRASLDEVRQVFLRINTLGRRLTEADAAFTRASRMNLRVLVTTFLRDLDAGFDNIPSRQVQAVLALHHGAERIDSKAIQKVIRELDRTAVVDRKLTPAFQKSWKFTRRSMFQAVTFLRQVIGVPHYSYLPSDVMFTMLSYFYHQAGNKKASAAQVRELRKWFWSTAFAGRYTGRGYFDNVHADLAFMRNLAQKGRSGGVSYTVKERIARSSIVAANYRQGTSLTKAFFLLLDRQGPKSFTHDYEIVPAERGPNFARAQKHHVFPRSYLTRHGVTKNVADRLLNMCFLPALENQWISNKAPREYLGEIRANNTRDFTRTMRSHLLNTAPAAAVWKTGNVKKNYASFIAERLDVLDRALRKESGVSIIQASDS